jgi:hypothetical protein
MQRVSPHHHATPLTVQGTQTLCGAFEQSAAFETLVLDEIPVFFRSSTLDSILTHSTLFANRSLVFTMASKDDREEKKNPN